MTNEPEVKYAKSGEVSVAYLVAGEKLRGVPGEWHLYAVASA